MASIKNKAGVLAYRCNRFGEIEILLVSARKFKDSWVFPVGTVEQGETLEETAARECVEESGYIIKIEEKICTFNHITNNNEAVFTFFKGKVIGETDDYEKDRDRIWVDLDRLPYLIPGFLRETAEVFKNLYLVNKP